MSISLTQTKTASNNKNNKNYYHDTPAYYSQDDLQVEENITKKDNCEDASFKDEKLDEFNNDMNNSSNVRLNGYNSNNQGLFEDKDFKKNFIKTFTNNKVYEEEEQISEEDYYRSFFQNNSKAQNNFYNLDDVCLKKEKKTIENIPKNSEIKELKINKTSNLASKLRKKKPKKKSKKGSFLNQKRKIFFKITNREYNYGNIIPKKCFRSQDVKNKILRNLIQDFIPSWITGHTFTKSSKINKDEIVNNIRKIKYKNMKISEIFGKNDFNLKKVDKIIKIKLEFTLREAFLCFAKNEFRNNIFLSVCDRLDINVNNGDYQIFNGLNEKHSYINYWADNFNQYEKIKKNFSKLIKDFE